jgi:ClpP class serine protease
MSRVFQALTAEPWAIEPSWLPLLAALAQRNASSAEVTAAADWQKRDFDMMAGPGATRLPGASRSYVVDGVAIIPVTGPIFPRANILTEQSGATSLTMLQNDFRAALGNTEVGAIMLLIDSPGGQVSGTSGFADTVAAGARVKPVIAHIAGIGASGAYWIASAAGEITMDRTAMVGSIGVAVAMAKQVSPDADGFLEIEVVSSNAPNKRPDPTTEDGLAEIRAMLDGVETQFIADVAKGRKVTTDKVIADFGGGGVKIGAAAVKAGMADKVQSQDVTLNGLRRLVANQRKLAILKQK